MDVPVKYLDSAARAADKEAARQRDAHDLVSDAKSREQLAAENSAFAFARGRSRLNIKSARALI